MNNEVGVVMPGVVTETNKNLRKIDDERDALGVRRFGIQKTLFQSGTIGVYRSEVDRSLPVEVPFSQFCDGSADASSRLVATIQVVNHASLRYIPQRPHDSTDDSYLSLYTDPALVPPPGVIRRSNLGHGYSVQLDKVLRRLTVRGPGILPGKQYSLKVTSRAPEGDGDYECDSFSQASSVHKGSKTQAYCHCNTPGLLLVDVPVGCAPDLQQVITVIPPDAQDTPFEVDPAATKVVWDPKNRVMILRSRGALLTNETPYRVVWDIKQKGKTFTGNTEEPLEFRGILSFRVTDLDIGIDSGSFIAIRDFEKTTTIDIDPRDTNAHEFSLTSVTRWNGPCGSLAALHATVNAEVDTVFGKHSIRDTFVENVPCTVVQLVDPVARKYRVEPDFLEALKRVKAMPTHTHIYTRNDTHIHTQLNIYILLAFCQVCARKEEILAQRAQLQNLDCLPDVWYYVMSPSEFVNFWAARGLNILQDGHRFVDPTREPDHPTVRQNTKLVREGEAHLRVHIEKRLQDQESRLNQLLNEYMLWLKVNAHQIQIHPRVGGFAQTCKYINKTCKPIFLSGVLQQA